MNLGILNRLIFGIKTLQMKPDGIMIDSRFLPYPPPYDMLQFRHGLLFDHLDCDSCTIRLFRNTPVRNALASLADHRDRHWKHKYEDSYRQVISISEEFNRFIASIAKYIRDSETQEIFRWRDKSKDLLLDERGHLHFGHDVSRISPLLQRLLADPNKFIRERNALWVNGQLEQYTSLFDSIEAHPLTASQRDACVHDEDNVLVVAGAGTGKTSTMRAKAAYLVDRGLAKPEEILMLAYGKDARKELEERVHERPELKGVVISTFHALGMEIIGAYEKRSTDVSVLATDERLYYQFIDEQIQSLANATDLNDELRSYFSQYQYPRPNDLDFKTHGEYLKFTKDNEIRDLAGNLVKSYEELEISNFLFMKGIAFEYEPTYPHSASQPGRKAYRPDYYLPDFDVYVEHFGIDKSGNTRPGIDRKKYNEEIQWKRALHERHNTVLLQTYSWQRNAGLGRALEQQLKTHCQEHGIDYIALTNPPETSALLASLKKLGAYDRFSRLLADFIALFKASIYDLNTLPNEERVAFNKARQAVFHRIFAKVYEQYTQSLQSANSIDFSDMIRLATKAICQNDFHERTGGKYRFRYIMVDEFQDISPIRAELVTALRACNPKCALFCVGDDWQAIYRFTGSNVSLTTNFSDYFGATHSVFLDKTFRFNNRIERVASTFVQQNKRQLPKQLVTHSKSNKTEVAVLHGSPTPILEQVLTAISDETKAKSDVLILARFNKSLEPAKGIGQRYPKLNIKYMTAHASKGKQADYVVILDMIDGKYGFPSKVMTDPLLESLLPQLEEFSFAEERRLFYVALTRARHSVFIQTELGKESVFLAELKEQGYDVHFQKSDITQRLIESAKCPECGVGSLIPITGKHGLFYSCSLGRAYCDTTVDACPECKAAPLLRDSEKHYCAGSNCNFTVRACPQCGTGKLLERKNSETGKPFIGCSNYKGKQENSCNYRESIDADHPQKARRQFKQNIS